jgi:hypothetical protein
MIDRRVNMRRRSFAHCFVGPEPIALKAGDKRALINGQPLRTDFRIVSEGNYQRIMEIVERVVEHTGVKIDELEPTASE